MEQREITVRVRVPGRNQFNKETDMTIEESQDDDLVTYPPRIQALIETCIRARWDKLVPGFNRMMLRANAEIIRRKLCQV